MEGLVVETCACVMSDSHTCQYIRIRHVSHERVRMSHVTHMNESCYTYTHTAYVKASDVEGLVSDVGKFAIWSWCVCVCVYVCVNSRVHAPTRAYLCIFACVFMCVCGCVCVCS